MHGEGQVLLSDDFSDPAAGWFPKSSPEPDAYQRGYVDGEYQIANFVEAPSGLALARPPGLFSDTVTAVDTRLVGDTAGREVQVNCRENSQQGSAYRLWLTPDRRTARITRRSEGRAVTLAERGSDAILPGEATNHVELTCAGDYLGVSVNGTDIVSVRDSTFTQGTVSLSLDRTRIAEVRFANFVVRAATPPSAAPAPGPPAAAASGPAPSSPPPLSDADIAARVSPSVVQVLAGTTAKPTSSGSGVKIAEGILTNAHVIEAAQRIDVIRSDGKEVTVKVIKSDATVDLALLRDDLDLPALPLASARDQRQGDPALVMGYPLASSFGLGGQASLTRGIISAVRTETSGRVMVQTDATFNPGNSGGAMVNQRGELIGVPTLIVTSKTQFSEGINLAVATESIRAFIRGQAVGTPSPTTRPAASPPPTTAAAAPQQPAPNVTTRQPGEVILSDDFEDPSSGALPQQGSNERGEWGYLEGEYRIAATATLEGRTVGSVAVPIPGSFRDVTLAVDARLDSEIDARVIALTCRDQVSVGLYVLLVGPSRQSVALSRVGGDGQATTLASAQSDAVQPGTETNHIELTCAGTSLTGSINGSVAVEADDSTLREGQLYLGVTGPVSADARFDNLVITQR